MNAETQAEVKALIKELQQISQKAKNQTSRILGRAAQPVANAIYAAAPHGRKIHKRYSTAKLVKGMRAPKGKGNVVATYYPGNLASSFQVMRFKRAKYSVWVASKLAKGAVSGTFGPFGRSDGYYAGMVEGGTRNTPPRPFVGPTWARMTEQTATKIINDLKRLITRIRQ